MLISIEVNNVENTLKSKVVIAILQEKFNVHDELLSQSRTFIEKIKGMNKVAIEQWLQNLVSDLFAKYYGPCVRELEAASQTDEKSKELIELIGLVDDTKYLLPEDKKESLAMTLVHKHPSIMNISDQQKLPLLFMFNHRIPGVLKDYASTAVVKRKITLPG